MFYPFFNPTPHLKVQQFEFTLYFKSVFPLANFSFWRRIKTSSDVCWSLRWKTLRNAALDNNSVQPLFCQTAGALKYETAIKSTDCFLYWEVLWCDLGGNSRAVCVRPGTAWEFWQVASTHTHTLSCTAALDPCSISPAVWWAAVVSCDQNQPLCISNLHLPPPETLQSIFLTIMIRNANTNSLSLLHSFTSHPH